MIDFTWKNEKASDHGVIVSSLAPITKPPERIEKLTIDGRDGDIISSQGFDAYDKQVQIGLSNNYDINWLMNWLQGSSKVIFSNESDIFYNAQITNSIDFKKMLTFKTATVTFHIQPYKYLNKETVIDSISLESIVINQGLTDSRPIMTIYGTGIIDISVNNIQYCVLTLKEENNDYITLNSIDEEAYTDDKSNLRNRNMQGEFPILQPGENIITLSGNVSRIVIEPKSRWL